MKERHDYRDLGRLPHLPAAVQVSAARRERPVVPERVSEERLEALGRLDRLVNTRTQRSAGTRLVGQQQQCRPRFYIARTDDIFHGVLETTATVQHYRALANTWAVITATGLKQSTFAGGHTAMCAEESAVA